MGEGVVRDDEARRPGAGDDLADRGRRRAPRPGRRRAARRRPRQRVVERGIGRRDVQHGVTRTQLRREGLAPRPEVCGERCRGPGPVPVRRQVRRVAVAAVWSRPQASQRSSRNGRRGGSASGRAHDVVGDRLVAEVDHEPPRRAPRTGGKRATRPPRRSRQARNGPRRLPSGQPLRRTRSFVDDLHGLAGRRVLLTGHTGFKGAWLVLWLAQLRAEVSGIALDPPTQPSLFALAGAERDLARHVVADIRDVDRLAALIEEARPEVILHLAAQSVVLEGYRNPLETFDVNVTGRRPSSTRCAGPDRAARWSSSPATSATRTTAPAGHSPRTTRWAATTRTAPARAPRSSWRRRTAPRSSRRQSSTRHGVGVATARAGNVIGGGDWTPDGLIADVARAVLAGRDVELRRPQRGAALAARPGAARRLPHACRPAARARGRRRGPRLELRPGGRGRRHRRRCRRADSSPGGARRVPGRRPEPTRPRRQGSCGLSDSAARGPASAGDPAGALTRPSTAPSTGGSATRMDPGSARAATLDDIAAYEAAAVASLTAGTGLRRYLLPISGFDGIMAAHIDPGKRALVTPRITIGLAVYNGAPTCGAPMLAPPATENCCALEQITHEQRRR